jgi:hypothetical protein
MRHMIGYSFGISKLLIDLFPTRKLYIELFYACDFLGLVSLNCAKTSFGIIIRPVYD